MDIQSIWLGIMGYEDNGKINDSSELFYNGKQVRMGQHAGKMARIVRLIRLMRVMKLYRNASSTVKSDATRRLIEDMVKESNSSKDLAKSIQDKIQGSKVIDKQMNTDVMVHDDR